MFHIRHRAVSQPLCAGALLSIAGLAGGTAKGARASPHLQPWQSSEGTAPREVSEVVATSCRVLSSAVLLPDGPQGPQRPTEPGVPPPSQGGSLAETLRLCEPPVHVSSSCPGLGVLLLLGLLLPHPLPAELRTSLPHGSFISLPLLCSQFPSPPNDSITRRNCIYRAVLACAVSLGYRGGSAEGGSPGGARVCGRLGWKPGSGSEIGVSRRFPGDLHL